MPAYFLPAYIEMCCIEKWLKHIVHLDLSLEGCIEEVIICNIDIA